VSNIEVVGIVVVGLAILFGLIIQAITLISKFMEPIKQSFGDIKETISEFTEAIHSLTIAVEKLLLGQERLSNEIEYHHGRLTELEKATQKIQINCAKRNHDNN
jgi:uncharacterized protein YoxC